MPTLRARRRVGVPLWLALLLKKQARCNIVVPDWLDESQLKAVYEEEKRDSASFQKLPWHWLEIGLALIDGAPDDLRSPANTLRALLQDIREVRQAKARTGLSQINESDLQMDDLSLLEINEMRPFMVMMMDQLRRMKVPPLEDEV